MLVFDNTISPLHQFDVFLCEYFAGTIAGWLLDGEVGSGFTDWFEQGLKQPQLQRYIQKHEERLLLGEKEMQAILAALDEPPLGFKLHWIPWPSLHESHALTLREIGNVLGKATADHFGEKSLRLGRELEQPGLPLHRGAECVVEWIEMVRGMKRAIRLVAFLPGPEGPLSTPTEQPNALTINLPPENASSVRSVADAEYLTVAETAMLLRCDRDQVDRLVRGGRLPALDLGAGKHRAYRISRHEIGLLRYAPAAPPSGSYQEQGGEPLQDYPRLV